MEKFEIKKNSWHFKFINVLFWKAAAINRYKFLDDLPKDFCTYWRHFIYSILLAVLYTTLAFLMVISVISVIFGAIANPMNALLFVGLLLIIFIMMIVLSIVIEKADPVFLWIWKYVFSWWMKPIGRVIGKVLLSIVNIIIYVYEKFPKKETVAEKKPSIMKMKYRSIKDKFCPMVEYSE